jgi:hypothetical protein
MRHNTRQHLQMLGKLLWLMQLFVDLDISQTLGGDLVRERCQLGLIRLNLLKPRMWLMFGESQCLRTSTLGAVRRWACGDGYGLEREPSHVGMYAKVATLLRGSVEYLGKYGSNVG